MVTNVDDGEHVQTNPPYANTTQPSDTDGPTPMEPSRRGAGVKPLKADA